MYATVVPTGKVICLPLVTVFFWFPILRKSRWEHCQQQLLLLPSCCFFHATSKTCYWGGMDVWPNKQVFGKGVGNTRSPPSKTGFDIAGLGSHALTDYLRLYLHFARSNQLFHFWSRMVAIAKDYAEREAWVPGGENLDGSTESTGDEDAPAPPGKSGDMQTHKMLYTVVITFTLIGFYN